MDINEFKCILENEILNVKGNIKSSYTKYDYKKIKSELPQWYEFLIENTMSLDITDLREGINYLYRDLTELPVCPVCGNKLKFQHFKMPYRKTCSNKCGVKLRKYNYEKFSNSAKKTSDGNFKILNDWLTNPYEVILHEFVPFKNSFTINKLIKKKEQCFYLLWSTKDLMPLPTTIKSIKELQISRRQYHILNELWYVPKCKNCGNDANYYNNIKGYSEYCKRYDCERERNKRTRRKTTHEKLNQNLMGYTILEQYKDRYTPIKIKHDECGCEFEYNCWNGSHISHLYLCPNCYGVTREESEIYEYVNSILPNTNIIKNDRKILNGLELDLYIPEFNLAIEYNGMYWHSEVNGKDKKYHLNKTDLCEKQGIQLLHVFSCEWNVKKDIIKSIIASKLGIYERKIYGRKCEVKEIENSIKNEFLNKNHIQGSDKSKYKLGLFFENELVSVMTFGKRSLGKGNAKLELIRFCNKLNTTVIGGASKLFKYFLSNYNIDEDIITYCDRRFSIGGFYSKLGFDYSHTSQPNYYYFKDDIELISRNKMMKHKMINILKEFDESLTEVQNAKNNGYNKIWDCGTYVYKFQIKRRI